MSNDNINNFFSATEKLANNGELDQAKRQLEKLIDDQPLLKARAYNDLGVIAYRKGEKNKTLEYYEQAVESAPKEPVYRKNLADLYYFEYGDAQTALAHYRQILVDNPTDFDANLSIGRICADLGTHFINEASDFFAIADKIKPGDELINAERKKIANRDKSLQSTQNETLRQTANSNTCKYLDPEIAYAKLAENFQSREPSEIESLILPFIEQFPDFALAHNDLGVISHQLEKFTQAGNCYRKAVSLAPENITFRKNLADFLFVIDGNHKEAMEHYHTILLDNPKDIETLLMIGNICMALDSKEEARNFFNLVLEIEPWNDDASEVLKLLDQDDKNQKE